MSWLFEGLGTEIVSVVIGLIAGGIGGYRVGIKKNIKQIQKAGDNTNQLQIGEIHHGEKDTKGGT